MIKRGVVNSTPLYFFQNLVDNLKIVCYNIHKIKIVGEYYALDCYRHHKVYIYRVAYLVNRIYFILYFYSPQM